MPHILPAPPSASQKFGCLSFRRQCLSSLVTPEGKLRSSQNALKHGLLAQSLVLSNESEEGFQAVLDKHLVKYGPLDGVELDLVEDVVAARWRMRRAWVVEHEWVERRMEESQDGDATERRRIGDAYDDLAGSHKLALLNRYEGRLYYTFQKSLQTLLSMLEARKPNEPGNGPS
jgi:hypothetical protein